MEIQPQSAPSPIARPEDTENARNPSALSSDFETFLKMLTTQMQNQDPLNPIESADFAVQLATFSAVEQQVQTNDLLRGLADGLGASGISQLAGWVGMEARVSAPAYFDGAPITLSPDADIDADSAELVVRNSAGLVVSRETVPLGQAQIIWAGIDQDGNPIPSGRYSLELENLKQGEVFSTVAVAHYSTIREARVGASGVEVVLNGGVSVASGEVTALRSPAEAD